MTVEIPRYELLHPIGSGGFSQVYQAWQPDFNRSVAVKVLRLNSDNDIDRRGFELECRAIGAVSEHPNIVTVYDSGFAKSGEAYIAMELYQDTLQDRMKASGFLPLADVLDTGVQICCALQRAHEVGILHRDIKPQNIMYSAYGVPALGDFGIAAISSDGASQKMMALSIHYAAPEVIEGATPTVESDLYSLGATLYTALAGRRPFARNGGDTPAALNNRIRSEPPTPIATQPIGPAAQSVLLGLLAKHPNDRPRSALELGETLRKVQIDLGLPATPLYVAEINLTGDDLTLPRSRSAPSIGRVGGVEQTDDNDTSSAVTTYRPTSSEPPPTSTFIDPPPDRRTWMAAGVLVAVILIVGIGALLTTIRPGRSMPFSPPSTAAAVTAPLTTTIIDLTPPDPPSNLTQQHTEDSYEISWDGPDNATAYLVEFVVGTHKSMRIEGTIASLERDIDLPACLTITTIASDGKSSSPSEPLCLGVDS